jgi:hypothetical protein
MKWFETAKPEDFERTREAAKAAKQKFYFPLDECKRGHLAPRSVTSNQCLKCKWILYQENLGPCTELELKRRAARHRKWRNSEAGYESNKRCTLAHFRKRTQRTPAWCLGERREIEEFYDTPGGMVVHHTVPLTPIAGNIVGLHCLANLEYVTPEDNSKRKNMPPGDMTEAEFVRRGMAVWRSDIGKDGRVNWRPYIGNRLHTFLLMLRNVTGGGAGMRAMEIFECRNMPFVRQAESWQALARWLNRVRDMPSGGLVLRKRRGRWVVRSV